MISAANTKYSTVYPILSDSVSQYSVLFVDDEPITRRISTRILSPHFTVVEAENGEEAKTILEKQGGQVGVIITDIKMEKVDGLSLIEYVASQYPAITIIASTGDFLSYDFDSLIQQGKLHAALEKPWDLDLALTTIRQAMSKFELNRSGDG